VSTSSTTTSSSSTASTVSTSSTTTSSSSTASTTSSSSSTSSTASSTSTYSTTTSSGSTISTTSSTAPLCSEWSSDLTGGKSASASSAASGYPASNAIDNNTSSTWETNNFPSFPVWWQVDFAVPRKIEKYRFRCRYETTYTWQLRGSSVSNFATYDVVHTVTSQSMSQSTWYEWEFSNSGSYRYYRIHITTGSSVREGCYEIEMMQCQDHTTTTTSSTTTTTTA